MTKKLLAYTKEHEEEADSLRIVLETNNIEYYETPESRWGFSLAAIWLANDEDLNRANILLKQHEEHFSQQARERYQAETGYNPNAPREERWRFYFYYLYKKRKLIPVVLLGFALIIWVNVKIFSFLF